MSAIEETEIEAGLIIFADNIEMRRLSDCMSRSANHSTDVKENHSLLVVEFNKSSRTCIVFPIFSKMKDGPSKFKIEKDLKNNWPDHSAEPDSFVHTRHSYEIPFETLIRASKIDKSIKGYRRSYADPPHSHLSTLIRSHHTNKNSPRPMPPLPAA